MKRLVALLGLVLMAGGLLLGLARPASAATPAADQAACSAVEWYRHVDTTPSLYRDRALWEQARADAVRTADHASAPLHFAIWRYIKTDRNYGRVIRICQKDTYGV